jgi:hypothetical protein
MRNRVTARSSVLLPTVLAVVLLLASACTPAPTPVVPTVPTSPELPTQPTASQSFFLPQGGKWVIDDLSAAHPPLQPGTIEIEGLGEFAFNPSEIATTRPDVFSEGHFSVFDIVAHLGNKNWFPLTYHFNGCLDTYVIDEIDGRTNWWYRVYTRGGWSEINASRMDVTPYREGTIVKLATHPEEYMGRIYNSFAEELLRKSINLGRVIIPEVRIGTQLHTNVPVSAHDFRDDVLQPGTVTALDVLLSLADQNKIERLKLTWRSETCDNGVVESLVVEQIDDGDEIYDDEASPETGGWVYETGAREFSGFKGSHTRVPADIRVIVSPEYMTWYWVTRPV